MNHDEHEDITVSNSELGAFRSCTWRHHLRYTLNLEPVREEFSKPLKLGSLVHDGLSAHSLARRDNEVHGAQYDTLEAAHAHMAAKWKSEMATMFDGFMPEEEKSNIPDEAATLLTMYDAIGPITSRYAVLGSEVPFRVPLLTKSGRHAGRWIEGVMDLVLWDVYAKCVVLGEFKTTAEQAHEYDRRADIDTQLPLYLFALRTMFGADKVSGDVVLVAIRKKAPSTPKVNQDGRVSVAACDTTRRIYQAALDAQVHERGLEVTDKQFARLETMGDERKFVFGSELHLDHDHVTRYAVEAWESTRLMRMYERRALLPVRNPSSCGKAGFACAYRHACAENLTEPDGALLTLRTDDRHVEVARAWADFNEGEYARAIAYHIHGEGAPDGDLPFVR